ncbi:MAG: protein kinase [Deltaproteobacteria bacterium]|nr:protein kinase [Deltaproteobacteria bacterium]
MTTQRWGADDPDAPTSSPAPQPTQTGGPASSSPALIPSETAAFATDPFQGTPSMASPSKIVAPFEEAAAQRSHEGEAAGQRFLAHFRVDKRLAAGGMGEVYLGFDPSLQRPVAIKTIRPELARDQGFLSRFLREAVAQANVVHPAVVQVYFAGVDRPAVPAGAGAPVVGDGGTWFIAMQVVDGGSLYDVLKDKKTLTWQQAADHMTGLVEGLCVAEERGIVHRDIKPANILIDRRGRALLADFGLAVAAGARDMGEATSAVAEGAPAFAGEAGESAQLQLMSITQVGVVMGTPEYVAPEQLKIGAVDVRADIYALAATFFHLMTGTPIADARNLPSIIAMYETGFKAKPIRSVRPSIPKAFADVIDRCLQVDRDQRPATMKELLGLLRRAAPQPEVPASPVLRTLVWAIDVAPFVAVSALTYEVAPWAGPLLFFIAGLVGMFAVDSTPGIWLMRLRLRTVVDGDVSVPRGYARFALQHGWYVPLTIGWSALYAGSDLYVALIVGAVWFALSSLGALGALFGSHQTLHDKLTGTRVLVDVR